MYKIIASRDDKRDGILHFARRDIIRPCLWLTKIRRMVLQLVKR